MNPEHSQHCHCVCTELSPLQEAIQRVRELHKPFGENDQWCDHCEVGQNSGYEWADYPCDTIKALDHD
jgi:hypothetical protein